MGESMINNMIFDIGGVLLDYNPKTYLDKLNIPEDIRKSLNDIIFHNSKWRDCLNGIIDNKELMEYLINYNSKYKEEIEKILKDENLKYMLPPNQEIIDYYIKLKKKGYKLYLCSNITESTYNYIRDNFNIIQEADGGVFSCFENISKPNSKIYYSLIKKFKINVNESVFIDDTKKNIEMAKQIGFKTILFEDKKQIEEIVELNEFEKMLRTCYSIVTAYPNDREKWSIDNPTCGQCAITALIIQENFGGTIYKININENETHYFSIINGEIVDITREQFDVNGIKIKYEPNEIVSREKILSNSNTNERYNILKEKLNFK